PETHESQPLVGKRVAETRDAMSFQVAPPNHRSDGAPEGDEVDRLLRGFYQAEMPDPWPSFEAPAETPRALPFPAPAPRSSLSARSRLALAASIALLVA